MDQNLSFFTAIDEMEMTPLHVHASCTSGHILELESGKVNALVETGNQTWIQKVIRPSLNSASIDRIAFFSGLYIGVRSIDALRSCQLSAPGLGASSHS
jgi:hypothetical protein